MQPLLLRPLAGWGSTIDPRKSLEVAKAPEVGRAKFCILASSHTKQRTKEKTWQTNHQGKGDRLALATSGPRLLFDKLICVTALLIFRASTSACSATGLCFTQQKCGAKGRNLTKLTTTFGESIPAQNQISVLRSGLQSLCPNQVVGEVDMCQGHVDLQSFSNCLAEEAWVQHPQTFIRNGHHSKPHGRTNFQRACLKNMKTQPRPSSNQFLHLQHVAQASQFHFVLGPVQAYSCQLSNHPKRNKRHEKLENNPTDKPPA